MADPVLRLGKGNTKVLFLCHFTRNLKSVVFVRITWGSLLEFIFLIDSSPVDLCGCGNGYDKAHPQ